VNVTANEVGAKHTDKQAVVISKILIIIFILILYYYTLCDPARITELDSLSYRRYVVRWSLTTYFQTTIQHAVIEWNLCQLPSEVTQCQGKWETKFQDPNPDANHTQNLKGCFSFQGRPLPKISGLFIHNFLRNAASQSGKRTERQKMNLITLN